MKGVILAGGTGSRLEPLTRITNKHLLPVYDRPMVTYAIEALAGAGIDEIMLVTGAEHAEDFFRVLGNGHEYGIRWLAYAYQERAGGIADALALARPFVGDGRVVVMLADNVYGEPVRPFVERFLAQEEGARVVLARVNEREHLRHLGVPRLDDGRIVDIVEKPKQAESRLATIGMYYFRTSDKLFDAIDRVLAAPPSLNNEYFIADAIQVMIAEGARLEPHVVQRWEDTGTPDYTLSAHRYLLDRSGSQARAREGVTIVPPVFIADDAEVRESVIGPYVTVEAGCRVERAVLADCILDEKSVVENQVLTRSLLGRRARLVSAPTSANVGDDAALTPPTPDPLPTL